MRLIKITYDVVTPESAEQGDFAESGWEDEAGIEITPDEYDLDDAEGDELAAVVKLATKEITDRGGVECSSVPWHSGAWYTTADGDIDYSTGASTNYSFHLDGFSEEEERAIYRALFPTRQKVTT